MSESFAKLGLGDKLVAGLNKLGITEPTPIQQQVIPAALSGQDVIGQSATGTGKTLAYLLPLVSKIDPGRREVQAVVLAPTYELASQIQQQVLALTAKAELPITTALMIGNVNITRQIEKLKEKPHIIVGSSGRILELMQKKKLAAVTVKTIVLDEADRLLNEGSFASVIAVIKATMRDRQLLLFSATMPAAVLTKAREFMSEPAIIKLKEKTSVPQTIDHIYFVVDRRDKIEVLRKLTQHLNVERGLVFINRGDDIETLVEKLNYHGLAAAAIHGDSNKLGRKAALDAFRAGKVQILVASDLAARGLDIAGVSHIFNLDLPDTPHVYQHRAGRTGRAGQSGTVVSLVTAGEAAQLPKIEAGLSIKISKKHLARGKVYDNIRHK